MKDRFYFKLFSWEIVIVKAEKPKENKEQPITSKKKKALKDSGLGWCEYVEKVQYPEALAKLKAKQITKASQGYNKIRAYRCEFCNEWHLTHKKDYLKMIR